MHFLDFLFVLIRHFDEDDNYIMTNEFHGIAWKNGSVKPCAQGACVV